MSTSITQVQNTNYINNAEFVRLEVVGPGSGSGVYTFSSSYKIETFAGGTAFNPGITTATYTALGGLVGISGHQRDLAVTSYDTTITLIGVDSSKIGLVIDAGLKGSKVQIWRGFYDEFGVLKGDPVLRYTGIVTGYNIEEERQERVDAFTVSLHCSSYKQVLENRVAGRHTNPTSWNQGLSSSDPAYDLGMNNVAALNNAKFNFGQKLA